MDKLQSDDLLVPTFLLKLPPQPDFNRLNDDDFLKNCVRWDGDFILDDFDE